MVAFSVEGVNRQAYRVQVRFNLPGRKEGKAHVRGAGCFHLRQRLFLMPFQSGYGRSQDG
jgi:hypothetical protein